MKNNTLTSIFFIALFFACSKDTSVIPQGNLSKGVFIINEGAMGTSPGSISFLNTDSNKITYTNAFKQINAYELGDVVQHMASFNNYYYIVVNNSNKIEVVDKTNFKVVATINGLHQPRYFLPISNTIAYTTQWGSDGLSGAVVKIDLINHKIIDSIRVESGPEMMQKIGDNVFVLCNGGYQTNNQIVVINTTTHQIIQKIQVADAPTYITQDKEAKLWVMSLGKYNPSWTQLITPPALHRINPSTFQIEKTILFPQTQRPSLLYINNTKDSIYYQFEGSIYIMSIEASLQSSAKILIPKSFYGLGINPLNNDIYGADALTFDTKALIYRYAKNGKIIDSFYSGGIATNAFLFVN